MDTKSPEVLDSSHGRGHLLFIAPWAKLAITPSLGKFQDDRTLRSDQPDAGPQRPVNGCSPRVASIQPQLLGLNSQMMTGRSTVPRLDTGPQCPVNGCSPRVASIQPQSLDLNGQVMTGRSCSK